MYYRQSFAVLLSQRECIQSIANYVKKNPRASQRELNAEVEKNVLLFASRVQALDTGH